MKRIRKLLSLALVLAMTAVLLSACGGNNAGNNGGGSGNAGGGDAGGEKSAADYKIVLILPGEVNEEVRKKAIGSDEVITCRPGSLLEPEWEKGKQAVGELARCEEDVMSYILFPNVAEEFLKRKYGKD